MTKRKNSQLNWKKLFPLVVGIGVPLLLVIYLFVTIYLPSWKIRPLYSFVYVSDCRYTYSFWIENKELKYRPADRYADPIKLESPDCLYKFDAQSKRSQKITLDTAKAFHYNSEKTSPDGFVVEKSKEETPSYFPFMSGGQSDVFYLRGNGLNQKVTDKTYDYDFQFIGWIE